MAGNEGRWVSFSARKVTPAKEAECLPCSSAHRLVVSRRTLDAGVRPPSSTCTLTYAKVQRKVSGRREDLDSCRNVSPRRGRQEKRWTSEPVNHRGEPKEPLSPVRRPHVS